MTATDTVRPPATRREVKRPAGATAAGARLATRTMALEQPGSAQSAPLDEAVGESQRGAHEIPRESCQKPAADPFQDEPCDAESDDPRAPAWHHAGEARRQRRKETESGSDGEKGQGVEPGVSFRIHQEGVGDPVERRSGKSAAEPPAVQEGAGATPVAGDEPGESAERDHGPRQQVKGRERRRQQGAQAKGQEPAAPAGEGGQPGNAVAVSRAGRHVSRADA